MDRWFEGSCKQTGLSFSKLNFWLLSYFLIKVEPLLILRHLLLQVTDSMLTNANFVYPENTPTTKEAYYYRTIFEKFFPKVGFLNFLGFPPSPVFGGNGVGLWMGILG